MATTDSCDGTDPTAGLRQGDLGLLETEVGWHPRWSCCAG